MAGDILFNKIAFIGIGLIGSSLARVIRRDGLAGSIVACARTEQTRQTALDLDLADSATGDVAEAVNDADLIVLCTPIGAYGAIAKQMSAALKPGAIVTDVGSVKRSVIEAVTPHLPPEFILCPVILLLARKIPARKRASIACLKIAGWSSLQNLEPMRWRLNRSLNCGGAPGAKSNGWTRIIMIRCWLLPRMFHI